MAASADLQQTIYIGNGQTARRTLQPGERAPFVLDFTNLIPTGLGTVTLGTPVLSWGLATYATATVSGYTVTVYLSATAGIDGTDYPLEVSVPILLNGTEGPRRKGTAVIACRTASTNPYDSGSLLYRAYNALHTTGWKYLGTLSTDVFRESDIVVGPDGHYYVFSTAVSGTTILYRTAATLAGIVSATPVQVLDSGSSNIPAWYPSVVYDTSAAKWYLIGTNFTNSTGVYSVAGATPNNFVFAGSVAVSDTPTGHIDANFRKITIGSVSTWILAHISDGQSGSRNFLRIISHSDPPTTIPSTWVKLLPQVSLLSATTFADIFCETGYPSWAAYSNPDPNFMTYNSRYYVSFAGRAVSGGANTSGIMELTLGIVNSVPVSAKATGTALALNVETDLAWTGGAVLSDLVFLACPDGTDRIFGFTNGGTTGGVWGCLELA